jgi:hypothetical protein
MRGHFRGQGHSHSPICDFSFCEQNAATYTPDYAPVQQLIHTDNPLSRLDFSVAQRFQRVMLLSSPDGKGRTMTDENRISNAGPNSPANDNEPTGNIQSALDPAAEGANGRTDPRPGAPAGTSRSHAEFERRLGQIANDNDNDPASGARPEQEE